MDTLPAELGALILENAPDIGSLWAFVRASPYMHSIFRKCREQILPVVIARDIGPVITVEALAALDSSRFTLYGEAKGKITVFIRGPPKSEALKWIENYFSESEDLRWRESDGANRRNISPSSDDMLPLWALHKEVKFIANLYVQETLPIMNHYATEHSPSPTTGKADPHTLDDLSSIEKDRILRAIYRFVIFGNLFARPSAEWFSDELCEHFLFRLPAWQVEELSCVNDFMTDRIRQKWQEMEDNEFNRLAAGDPQLWEIEPRPDPWNCRWDADFYSSETKGLCFEGNQAFLTSLPIEVLTALFQAEGGVLEELVRKWDAEWRGGDGPFLIEALDFDPRYLRVDPGGEVLRCDAKVEAWDARSMSLFDREKPDSVMSANIGWYWTHEWQPFELYVNSTSNAWGGEGDDEDSEGFRRLGYVFWDRWRLRSLEDCNSESFGKKILEKFPRPASPDKSLSVEERIREMAGCGCGGAIRPEDSKCKIKGHRVKFEYPCGPGAIGKEV